MDEELVYINAMLTKTAQNKTLACFLFKKLFTELPLQLEQIEQALILKKITQAMTIAHKLHGSMVFCGFFELSECSKVLEISLSSNNLSVANEVFFQLKQKISSLQRLEQKILNHFSEC